MLIISMPFFHLQILVTVFSSCQPGPVGGPGPDLLLHFQHSTAKLEVNYKVVFDANYVKEESKKKIMLKDRFLTLDPVS